MTTTTTLSAPCLAGVHNDCRYSSHTRFCDCLCHRGGLPPIARKTDPNTSHQAAEAITKNGQRGSQCKDIFDAIQAKPGSIPGEIAAKIGLLSHEVTKRIHDLEVKGLVVPGTERRWAGSGKNQRSWWPTSKQGEFEI